MAFIIPVRRFLSIISTTRLLRFSFLFSGLLLVLFFFIPALAHASALVAPPNNLGLVGYWSFDEGTGTIAVDHSGNKNNLACTNTGWALGKKGAAGLFDGGTVNSFCGFVISGSSNLQITGNVSISAWIYSTSTAAVQTAVRGGISTDENYSLIYNGTTQSIGFQYYNGSTFPSISSNANSVLLNQWNFVSIVRSGTTVTFYVNGVAAGSGTVTLPSNVQTWFRLGESTTGNQVFQGLIDDVRIYNRALGASEIASLYQSGATQAQFSGASLDNGSLLNQGLIGYWSFDNTTVNWKTGRVSDLSGNGNNGAMVGLSTTTSPVIGKLGQALMFSGANSDVTTSTFAIPTANFTWSVWFKPVHAFNSSMSESFDVIASSFIDSNNRDQLYYKKAGGVLQFSVGASGSFTTVLSDTVNFSANTWYHAVVTRSGTNWILYINGVQVASATSAVVSTAGNRQMQIATDGVGDFFNGSIDDVRIYNRALSPSEVSQLYTLGQTQVNVSSATQDNGSSLSQGLVGLWTFDGPTIGTTIQDSSGNGNNAYIVTSNGAGTPVATSSMKTIGREGQALSFNGATCLEIPNGNPFNFTSNFTIGMWEKSLGNTGTFYALAGEFNGVSNPTSNWDMDITNLTGRLRITLRGSSVFDSNSNINGANSPNLNDGKWHYVTAVNTLTSIQLFVDGQLLGSASGTWTPNINSLPLYIGCRSQISSTPFLGSIDDVRIYNRALSASEVQQLYNLGK